jgi:hypothetical protein
MVIETPAGDFVYLTPEVAMANLHSLQRRDAVRAWKQGIKNAFNCKCAYCGVHSDSLTLDHVHPRTKGGEDLATNIVPACVHCNQDKGSQNWRLWYRDNEHYSAKREWMIEQWMNSLLCPIWNCQLNNNCA